MKFRLSIPLICVSSFAFIPSHATAAEIPVTVIGQWEDGGDQILRVASQPGKFRLGDSTWKVPKTPGAPRTWIGPSSDSSSYLLRRPLPAPGQGGVLEIIATTRRTAAESRHKLVFKDLPSAPRDPGLKILWLRSFRDSLSSTDLTFTDFARKKLDDLIAAEDPAIGQRSKRQSARVGVEDSRRRDASSLSGLMDTMTGMTSIHEALQVDRKLRTRFGQEPATIPLGSLKGPDLVEHPWNEMSTALGKPVPNEPLAAAAPANFYYLRFATLSHLFRLLDESDAWITPVAGLMSEHGQDRGLGKRYETALGLSRSRISRELGPQVVSTLALVGSDPYFREGTDLTLVFQVKSQGAFELGLQAALASHETAHGKLTKATFAHAGVSMVSAFSADGQVHQFRAQAGGFSLVSNSQAALSRVIDTIQGKAAALKDQRDFRYFLARDAAVPADVLGFLGDAFVSEVVGPRQKIQEARRMMAGADLLAPGYAALLFGQLYGKSPTTVEELQRAGLLSTADLRHPGGEAIAFTPGMAARSAYGQVAGMTPLIDLPAVSKVTATEREAYRLFADSYQRNYATFMDPICLRARFDAEGSGPIQMDLRVLPVIDNSEYREIQNGVGNARVEVPPGLPGTWLTLGVGPQAELRRMITKFARMLPSIVRSQLDWLGDLAFVGIDDRFNAKGVIDAVNAERVNEKGIGQFLHEAPIHAGMTVKNRLTATLTLAAIRTLVLEAAPGAVTWAEKGKVREVPYVAISAGRDGELVRSLGELSLYYAFCKEYLVLSLGEATLKDRINDCVEGRLPKSASAERWSVAQKPQLVSSLGFKKNGPSWQLMGALLGAVLSENLGRSMTVRHLLETGAPELDTNPLRELSRAYLGYLPLGHEGKDVFSYAVAPYRDGPPPPKLQPLAEGSLAARFMQAIAQSRGEIAFDEEALSGGERGPIQSLHLVFKVAGH